MDFWNRNRAKLAEKRRLRAARLQKKSNPSSAAEYQEKCKEASRTYNAKRLLAFKKREKRAEAAEVKHGRKEANRRQDQRETARDYKVEYELMKSGAEDAFRERVMHAMWNPAPGEYRIQFSDGSYKYFD
ncbi:hypothetical protein R3P38DRAFT_3164340 [Favolaschia claudopus]|uniref:Uncharacterized protein n=1 Tax=Favolaschia claudopus TaxID=2862362 RepID=A0AAW0EEJ8_9AGAR